MSENRKTCTRCKINLKLIMFRMKQNKQLNKMCNICLSKKKIYEIKRKDRHKYNNDGYDEDPFCSTYIK